MLISVINNLLKVEGAVRLIKNIFSLGAIQTISFVVPLITFPYLVRVIGTESFGLLAFSSAFIAYFCLIADYGFSLSATKEVSVNRSDVDKLNEIFNAVMVIKLLFVLLAFFLISFLVLMVDRFRDNWALYYFNFGVVLGQALLPLWLFQGMENMKPVAYLSVFSKACYAALIFLFVKSHSDYILVPLLLSIEAVVVGLFSLFYAKKVFSVGFDFRFFDFRLLKYHLYNGWHIFLSRIYVHLYGSTNLLILGFMTNNSIVGYYAIAEKAVQAFSGLFAPILQAFYPYMAALYRSSKSSFFRLFDRFNLILFFLSLTLFGLAMVMGHEIMKIVSGKVDFYLMSIFTVLSVSIITSPFGPSFTNGLLVMGENKSVSKVVRNTFLLNMIMVVPLIYGLEALGLAVVWVLGQFFHVVFYVSEYKAQKRKVLTCVA